MRTLGLCTSLLIALAAPAAAQTSINSTAKNNTQIPAQSVPQQALVKSTAYKLVVVNDLGMHCGDVDHRVASILPPFNVLHAQPIKMGVVGAKPALLDNTAVDLFYSATANASDPLRTNPAQTGRLYKTNFWDVAYRVFNPFYPPGVLANFPLTTDIGLPVPDVERLYLGDGVLVADQQKMPGASSPYVANTPQPFGRFQRNLPFFVNPAFSAFNYTQTAINWFAAEGIPITTFDDVGRTNPYPLFRVQVKNKSGAVLVTTDAVVPVSGEANCWTCHTTAADGGNGTATSALAGPATSAQDPSYGGLPAEASREWAADTNILRIHDLRTGTNLVNQQPLSCQKCHYTPALDLAQVGPLGPTSLYPNDAAANGREQRLHGSMSRVMHGFHSRVVAMPTMPPPTDARRQVSGKPSITTFVQTTLEQTCYSCHPGKSTKCLRGAMFDGGLVCQDCHGQTANVGNDFSKNVSTQNPNAFVLDGSLRIPWANEPRCQSCHTGDALSNLGQTDANVIKSSDGIRLLAAYRTNDASAKPITAVNRRFAENQYAVNGQPTKEMLYRVSKGHGGVFCEGCHGSTHAEWGIKAPNRNDNVTPSQLQGHNGTISECTTCHTAGSLSTTTLGGPHGMHQVNYSPFFAGGHENLYKQNKSACKVCHGADLKGTVLSRTPVARSFSVEGGTRTAAAGEAIGCSKCHSMPSL